MEKKFNFKRTAFIIGYTALAIFLSTKASEKTWLFVLIWAIWFGITSIMVMIEGAEDNNDICEYVDCPTCKKKTLQNLIIFKGDSENIAFWQCTICHKRTDFNHSHD